MANHDHSRREFIKKAAYTAPIILSLSAMPAFAKTGSVRPSHGKFPVERRSSSALGGGTSPIPPNRSIDPSVLRAYAGGGNGGGEGLVSRFVQTIVSFLSRFF